MRRRAQHDVYVHVRCASADGRVGLVANDGWIMGGTEDPTPDSGYLSSVESLYLGEDSGYTFDALTTPEQFCPIVCNCRRAGPWFR